MKRILLLLALAAGSVSAQDPFKLEFENDWVRVSRITYPAFGKSKTHLHPVLPTVYVYLTDGGPMSFIHSENMILDRPAVKAGGIRFNRGMIEKHEVESLSDQPSEYLRIELKTEPLELPGKDIRIAPEEARGFENAQIGIEKLVCASHTKCGVSLLPSVVVNLNDRTATWIQDGAPVLENVTGQPVKQIRIVLKSAPIRQLITARN